jgi:hypothetical protein
MNHVWNLTDNEKQKYSEYKPRPQSHFVYKYFVTDLPGNESVSLRWEDDNYRPDPQNSSLSEKKDRRMGSFGTVLSV